MSEFHGTERADPTRKYLDHWIARFQQSSGDVPTFELQFRNKYAERAVSPDNPGAVFSMNVLFKDFYRKKFPVKGSGVKEARNFLDCAGEYFLALSVAKTSASSEFKFSEEEKKRMNTTAMLLLNTNIGHRGPIVPRFWEKQFGVKSFVDFFRTDNEKAWGILKDISYVLDNDQLNMIMTERFNNPEQNVYFGFSILQIKELFSATGKFINLKNREILERKFAGLISPPGGEKTFESKGEIEAAARDYKWLMTKSTDGLVAQKTENRI